MGKYKVTIDFGKVMDDCVNKLHLRGRSIGAAEKWENPELASYRQGGGSRFEVWELRRRLEDGWSQLLAVCDEWLERKTALATNVVRQQIWDEGRVELILSMPECFDINGMEYIGTMVHDYLVARAVADYIKITGGDDMQSWIDMATEAMTGVRKALHGRRPPSGWI